MLKWKIEEEKQGSKLSITINVDNVLTVSFQKSIDIERTKKKTRNRESLQTAPEKIEFISRIGCGAMQKYADLIISCRF